MNRTAQLPPAILLMGPTASGKTDLAMALCDRLPCEIISVDSALVYRGMDIGTAKPSALQLSRYPHRLIDIRDPAEPYSAATFRDDALREMEDITDRGKIPLLVGGTMLYFKILLQGMSDLPAADKKLRREINDIAAKKGWPEIHRQLAEVDPPSAQRINPNDPQRLQRALEVYRLTGVSMSEWRQREQNSTQRIPYHLYQLAIAARERSLLHQRIEQRFYRMLDQGFVDEVRQLQQRPDMHIGLPAIRAVGYRQVWDYLSGELRYDEMVERGIIATRQLAKRQYTWLRSWQNLNWLMIDQTVNDTAAESIAVKTLEQLVDESLRHLDGLDVAG